ncbi:MAG TPA: flagellin [Oscillatoriaceae cyanobacterium]
MALSIQNQVLNAQVATTFLNRHLQDEMKWQQRASSGSRINQASDDPAGLWIADTMQAQVRGSQQASRNIQDANSLLNVADAAVSRIANDLNRMRELATQSANSTYSNAERGDMDVEFQQLRKDIDYVTQNADFNGYYLLRGGAPTGWTTNTTSVSKTVSGTNTSDTITPNSQTFATGASGPFTLATTPAVYGLGSGGPQSIVVTAFDTGTGTTRTIPYDPTNTNGFSFNAGTNQITLSGTGLASPTEKITVKSIPAGSTTINLPSAPQAGSESVTANGVPVPNAGSPAGNGYYLSGSTLSLEGTSLPDAAGGPVTIATTYMPNDPSNNSINLNTETPFFEGGVLDPGTVVTVDGVPVTAGLPNGYTVSQTETDNVNGTPLYSYQIQLNGTSQLTGSGPHTISVNYSFDYPTGVDPLNFQVQEGANQGQTETLSIDRLTSGGMGLGNAHVDTQNNAMAVLNALNNAVYTMDSLRGSFGAYQNGLNFMNANVNTAAEDQAAAESQIRDADMAQVISQESRASILAGAATGVLQDLRQNSGYLIKLLAG